MKFFLYKLTFFYLEECRKFLLLPSTYFSELLQKNKYQHKSENKIKLISMLCLPTFEFKLFCGKNE